MLTKVSTLDVLLDDLKEAGQAEHLCADFSANFDKAVKVLIVLPDVRAESTFSLVVQTHEGDAGVSTVPDALAEQWIALSTRDAELCHLPSRGPAAPTVVRPVKTIHTPSLDLSVVVESY